MALQAIGAATAAAIPQLIDVSSSTTALPGIGNATNSTILGNYYNYWSLTNNKTTYDLTRSDRMPVTKPKSIPMIGSRKEAIIEPSRSAFVIVDMQNFFLHPQLSPKAVKGRNAVQPTLNLIDAFREEGIKILWTNWGLDNFDLVTIPPSFLEGFSDDGTQATTFGSDMGTLTAENGSTIEVGRKLWRGSWNGKPYGPLGVAMDEGIGKGTDLLFYKSKSFTHDGQYGMLMRFADRLSGLWGAQTPLGLYLQENDITTLFLGGVNSDQCVWSTLIDAYFKGFDTVYVEDCAATTSPWYAEEMVRYNGDSDGFLANSTYIIDALKKQR